ncbi:L-carnitine dehydratase/bile acid-inducible protein F [Parafrankia sp. Ea1.12]|nr:L-carnitine dehydratase/bile acid-inducible protein F [Parafrankia sp. Ea1.12]
MHPLSERKDGKPGSGPLAGVKVVELAGRGPGPFGAMILADLGAEVVRVARLEDVAPSEEESATERSLKGHRRIDLLTRGRRSVALDLKHPGGVEAVLRMVDRADVLVEGYRPGVAERLGLGPDECLWRNPRLVYARMTGFGQEGPYARSPGHDINYVALAGALDPLRRPGQPPAPPLNLLGDFGGGGMLLALGVLGALVERARSGLGQVVDAAMVDGVALLTTLFHGMRAEGLWSDEPGSDILSLAAPFYNVYETSDGRYVAVGAGESQFYAELLQRLGLGDELLRQQGDPTTWPAGRAALEAVFRTRTLAEWTAELEGTDTCFTPVLTMEEATRHPHNVERRTFVEVDGVVQPAPAPRFSRTPAGPGGPPAAAGQHTREVLLDWGFAQDDLDALLASGAARQAPTRETPSDAGPT